MQLKTTQNTDYTQAIKLEPEKIKYINNRAEAYYWNDEYKKALKDWNKILELDNEYEINYYYKAYTENELGLYKNALLSINKVLNQDPNDEDAEELKNIINENLNQDKTTKNLISNYTQTTKKYLENGFYSDAYNYCQKILELDPNNIYAHLYLGVYYYYQKDFSNAKKEYEQAIKIDKTFAKAYCNLGILLLEQGNFSHAVTNFKLAEKYDPSLPNIQKLKKEAQKK